MQPFTKARFLGAAGRETEFPPGGPPELAFAGRSNVGKSSAINALTTRKRLAYTSKTPGRTQTVNFYSLGDEARLVDLPGYGYARVPQPLRAQWKELVGAYLRSRTALAGIVLVMDARHPLTPLDRQLLDWLDAARVLVLLSKCDKLARNDQQAALRQVCAELRPRCGEAEARLFSSVTRQGVDETRMLLETWLRAEARRAK